MTEVSTKEQILRAAAALFADKGYDSVSIKEICDRSDANIAAVHYHFGSKEQLYRAIFQDFGKNRLQKLENLLEAPATAEEFRVRLRIYLEQAVALIDEEPHVAKIIFRDGHLVSEICADIFENTFLRLYDRMLAFLGAAQKKKILSAKADTATIAQVIDAVLCAKVFEQKDLKKVCAGREFAPRSGKAWLSSILSILFDGIIEKEKTA